MTTPQRLYARGRASLSRARHAEARRLLEEARLGARGDLLARIETSLAYLSAEQGDGDAALALCREALTRDGIEDGTRGLLHGQAGLVLMLRGDGEGAVAELGQAVQLLESSNERARVHLNRGNVFLQQHELEQATGDFATAAALYAEAGDDFGAAKALHNRGYVALLAGDIPAALRDMAAAYDTFVVEGPVMTAMVDQDRAEALIAAGLVEEGVAALRSASSAYGRRRLYQRRGEAELARARYEREAAVALGAARTAANLFRRSGAAGWAARAEAEELIALATLGRTRAVTDRGPAVADVLDRHRLRWNAVAVRLEVVRALLAEGRTAEARNRLRRVRLGTAAPLPVRLTDRDVRAAVAARPGQALAHVRAGLDELHAWQSSFGSLDLQTNVVGHGVRLAVRGLSLAVGSRSDAVLFEWSERARMLASRIQPVRAPQDPQTTADLAELRAGPAPEREAELRRQIRERAWQHRGSGEVSEPVSLSELQAALGEQTALVAYVVTADRIVGLVVTDESTRRHDLGARDQLEPLLSGLLPDLDMAAAELPPSLARSVRGALMDRVSRVGDLLVAP
ncbi:MAG: hypothetical protein ACJ8DJ_03995, partial [Gemmatimonadales bacterium]